MTIRRAILSDIDSLVDLYRQLIKHTSTFGEFHPYSEELVKNRGPFYKEIISSENRGFILLEEDNGKIIGMLVVQYGMALPGDPLQKIAMVQDVFILPDTRKKGLGKGIMDEALRICKEVGIDCVSLWVAPENKFLHKQLEEKYGFKDVYVLKSLKL